MGLLAVPLAPGRLVNVSRAVLANSRRAAAVVATVPLTVMVTSLGDVLIFDSGSSEVRFTTMVPLLPTLGTVSEPPEKEAPIVNGPNVPSGVVRLTLEKFTPARSVSVSTRSNAVTGSTGVQVWLAPRLPLAMANVLPPLRTPPLT